MKRIDVAIVGAGAAGLAAAGRLHRRQYDVAVFEARDRIGGRILTHVDPRVPLPIELGAEFIHGEAPATERVLREAGLVAYDVAGEHWSAMRGTVRRTESWRRFDRILERINMAEPDRSFSDFLAGRPGGRSLARERALAREFVQSYHAADAARISAHSVAPEEGEPPSDSARRIARIVQGYGGVTRWLARDLASIVRLQAPVTAITWEPGRAELAIRVGPGRTSRILARAVLVTVPLGVLQARAGEPGSLAFHPDPPRIRKALGRLAMGSVMRLTFWFRDFPWNDAKRSATKNLERMSFLHTRGAPFNVWWTARPMRWPLAVAWSGGPPAAELARGTRSEMVSAALGSLARSLGTSRRRVESSVRRVWTHDWDGDPFARGAYSYVCVHGTGAARALSRPVDGTLFFAGEATDAQGATGTVEGAITSGLRAARQVDSTLGREQKSGHIESLPRRVERARLDRRRLG